MGSTVTNGAARPATRLGRRPATTAVELSHVAIRLFRDQGYEATTVDDIAAAAGIGRRTFFRYFPSKNDAPWGDFEQRLARLREFLREQPRSAPLMEVLRAAVLEFNRVPPEEAHWHRERMRLLLYVPALQAHSILRYAAWRDVIAEYVADRLGLSRDDHPPQAIAWALLGTAISAYEQWLRHDDADLAELLDEGLRMLRTGFALG